jgi:hypothetical protein
MAVAVAAVAVAVAAAPMGGVLDGVGVEASSSPPVQAVARRARAEQKAVARIIH